MSVKPLKIPKAFHQTALYAAALVSGKLVAVTMLPVFTHFLTPEQYGRLDILQTLANLLSIVIGFGLADTLFRFLGSAGSPEEERHTAASVYGLALVMAVISFLVTQSLAPQIADLLPGEVSIVQTRLILASLSLSGLILVPLSWMRFQDMAMGYFIGSVGRAVAQALLVTVFLALGWGIDGVLFAGFLCAVTLAVVLGVWHLRTTGLKFSLIDFKAHSRFGGMLVLAGSATFVLDSCDRWFLADAVGPVALAHYALAAKIGIMAAFMTQPFDLWWMPRRFKVLERDGAEACARKTEIGFLVAMLAAISLSGSAAVAITLITPAAYHPAIAFAPAMAALAALNAATGLVMTGVLSREKTLMPVWIDGTAALVVCVGYVFLIPAHGGWGAIGATAVALSCRFVMYVWFGQRTVILPYRWGRLAALGAVTLTTVIFCSLAEGLVMPFLVGTAGGLAVLALAILLDIISLTEVRTWQSAS